jgi:dTDP-4-dehydrorhamnose 3,5-epimerase
MSFIFEKLQIPEVLLVKPKSFADERGFFTETYKESEFKGFIDEIFVQDNHSKSNLNVLRGLHYQTNPKAQGKLVSVIKGRVFDVAVDIRKGSSTYGKWVGEVLSEENQSMLYVPVGFAHGFVTLDDDTHVTYKVTNEYSPEHERSIRFDDPTININWQVDNPILAPKDLAAPFLSDTENDF